jgi:signal transduction histidine kinase/ActR/RegA family two-component response regulator
VSSDFEVGDPRMGSPAAANRGWRQGMLPRVLPLQRQLALGTVVASGVAVLLLGVSFTVYDFRSFEQATLRRLGGEAEIVGTNCAAALLFRDPAAAAATLEALRAEPSVLSAAVYDNDGRVFARFARPGVDPLPSFHPTADGPIGHAIRGGRVLVSRPVVFKGERVGTVAIEATLAERTERLRRQGLIAVLTSLGAFAVASLIASRMQRTISGPILDLARTARFVSTTKDYSTRAAAAGPQEIGVLVSTFNEMLDAIQRREAELEQIQRALEETLEERTVLYRQAEEANRAKDQFLATLSHELRTPLNAIVGWTSILAQGGLDDEATERAVGTIERNAKAQAKLIEDILDVSRIVSGKLHLSVSQVDLPAVVQSAADSLRHAAEAKQIRIQLVLDGNAGPVSGDSDRLQQVIWNLMSNAIKFTPRGGRVYVRLSRPNSHVELAVTDNGIGIRPEFLPHVFERFRQADSTSTRSYGGLGLGLAIVRHIVELHGGTVEARSAGDGQGASFVVTLPLAPVAARSAPEPGERRLPAATPTAAPLDGIRVLVVDDDQDSLDLLEHTLTRAGATVVTASSAADALGAIERQVPDVLVSDIEMPGEDGYALIRRIRVLPASRGGLVPAAALTAYARSEDRVTALKMGYQIHLAKPVDPVELAVVVSSLAGRQPVQSG